MSYNGWENYETWCVNLWLSNDQGLYEEVRDKAYNYLPSDDEDEEYNEDEAINNFANEINTLVDSIAPETQGMFRDLLTTALGRVDWQEIAQSWLQDAKD